MTREEAIAVLKDYDEFCCGNCNTNINYDEAIDMAIEALSADAVAVVRCKDCRYRKKVGTSYYCELDEFNVKDADFCSWGERREE